MKTFIILTLESPCQNNSEYSWVFFTDDNFFRHNGCFFQVFFIYILPNYVIIHKLLSFKGTQFQASKLATLKPNSTDMLIKWNHLCSVTRPSSF